MSRFLAENHTLKCVVNLEHPKNECLSQTTAFKKEWHIVFLMTNNLIYEPSDDSFLLAKQVKKYAKNKKVLDIGSGSGIQALTAKKAKAKSILASDINKLAVKKIKSLGIESIYSNLFSKIKGRYDLIIFNPPYLPEDKNEDSQSSLITSGGKKGDELTLKFLKQAKKHLKKSGIILIVISSLSPFERIESTLKGLNLKFKILESKNLFMERLSVLEIKYN
ncbi:MAG: HemK2/MTQ2 family protein methyltransferase [Nanoarchaeota archaeon]